MERCVRHISFRAVSINLKIVDGSFVVKEVLTDVLVDVRYHGCVMVRVVPSPMLGSLVIVEEHPLETFKILHKHPFLEDLAFF